MTHPDSPLPAGLRVAQALRRTARDAEQQSDMVIDESAVALSFNGDVHAVMMATDADLEDYALGFALNEAIVAAADEWTLIDIERRSDGIVVESRIPQSRFDALRARQRRLAGNSGCGLCGTESLAEALRPLAPLSADFTLSADSIPAAMRELATRQVLNRRSGGAHAAGYFARGFACVREDIGRHNALDKLCGAMARAARPHDGVLALSSRASYELVHKAASMGMAVMATVSAPSSAAIALADRCCITLASFARDAGFNLYTHPQRIELLPRAERNAR